MSLLRQGKLFHFLFTGIMLVSCYLVAQTASIWADESHEAVKPSYNWVELNADAQKNARIKTVLVKEGTLSFIVQALSYVMADETKTIHLKPVGSGKVLQINLTPGAKVKKGEALLTYRNHSLRIAHIQAIQAHAALAAAQAVQSEAEAAYQRAKQLAGHALSRGEENRRYALLQEAKNSVAMREADVTNTDNRVKEFDTATEQGDPLQTSQIISPVNGVILSTNTSVDADLAAGQDIATVVDLSSVWIISEVPPSDAILLAADGKQLSFLPGKENEQIASTIDTIDGIVNPMTGLVRVRSRVSNEHDSLKPGMMLETRFTTSKKIQGQIIPTEAIQQINGSDIVFVQTGANSFEPRLVAKGIESDGQTIILKGLKEGEKIVSQGGFTLKSVMLLADASRSD